MKLLLVKTSSLGDVIHTLPAVTDALVAIPGLAIDWMVEAAFADVARLHPGVRTVHEVAVRRWRRALFRGATWTEVGGLRSRLRGEGYDFVLDAQGLVKSAALARLAGSPVAGLDRASLREPAAAFAYARRFAVPKNLHAIERTRRLFGLALGYAPDLERLDYGIAAPPLPADVAGRGPLAMLLHGTTWPTKRWPTRLWAETASRLADDGLTPAVTYVDEAERAVAQAIAAAEPRTLVIPRRPIREIAGVIAASRIVVGADTGLMHLAAAFGVPTAAVFTSTAPGLTAPKGARVAVLTATTPCAPCRRRDCPLVAAGVEPPCQSTVQPARILETMRGAA